MKLRTIAGLSLVYGAAGLALGMAAMGSMDAFAQGASSNGIGSHNSRAPVTVDAGSIELQDRQNRVAFSGDVIVTQDDLTLRAQRMLLNYVDTEAVEIQRITATGGVNVVRGDERASGNTAIYDFNRRIITMAGDVRLRRGTDTLNGGRLVIDLRSGISSVDGRAAGSSGAQDTSSDNGRVTGTFTVPQDDDEEPQD